MKKIACRFFDNPGDSLNPLLAMLSAEFSWKAYEVTFYQAIILKTAFRSNMIQRIKLGWPEV